MQNCLGKCAPNAKIAMALRDPTSDPSVREREHDFEELQELATDTRTPVGHTPVEQRPIRVLDLCSGPGGVGVALQTTFQQPNVDGWFLGVDTTDYTDTYPGHFRQQDISDLSLEDLGLTERVDLVWVSFPCLAYTKLSHIHHDDPTDAHPTIPEYSVRELCERLGHHYVIENVETCHDLREDRTVKVNGQPFGLPLDYPRLFESSFASQFQDTTFTGPTADTETVSVATATSGELADAKRLPEAAAWSEQEAKSALPPQYVAFILSHCPTLPEVRPPGGTEEWYKRSREDGQHSIWSFVDDQDQ